jgi:putative ABC transport system permease protein
MWFSTFIFKNLIRRPLRSLLTAFAVALAIGSVIALVGIANGFEQTFLTLYADAKVDMIVVRSGARQRMNSTLDESLGDKIKQIDGVREVLSGLADLVSFEDAGLYSVVIQGFEPKTAVFDHMKIIDGRSLVKGDKRVALLGTILAGNLGKKVGEDVEVVEGEIGRAR